MKLLTPRLRRALHHKRLSSSSGAIAGMISATSVIVGALAAYAAPKGWHKVALTLHFAKKPLLLKIAPVVAGIAVAVATAASLIKFLSWCLESDTEADCGATGGIGVVVGGDQSAVGGNFCERR